MTDRTFDIDATSRGLAVYVYDGVGADDSWLTWAEVLEKLGLSPGDGDEILGPID